MQNLINRLSRKYTNSWFDNYSSLDKFFAVAQICISMYVFFIVVQLIEFVIMVKSN